MNQFEDIETSWSLLDSTSRSTGDFRVREVDDLNLPGGKPLLALDSTGQRHLLIPIQSDSGVRQDSRSSGIHLLANHLIDNGQEQIFIDLVCRKPHLDRLFSVVLTDVLIELRADSSRPYISCQKVLNRWREFFERESTERPSLEAVVGMFGELWHLRKIVQTSPQNLSCWVGPLGARHDFQWGKTALEAKTSLARTGWFIKISSVDQLAVFDDGELYLAVLKLERSPNDGETLSKLIDDIKALGGDSYTLWNLLAHAGFEPNVVDLCSELSFRVFDQRIFRVNELFPKITIADFKDGQLPSGVLALSYEIDVSRYPSPLSESQIAILYNRLTE